MKTALWTVTFAHKSLWDEFQTWLKSRGLRTWVMGREEDEVSHGIGFAGCREKDCDNYKREESSGSTPEDRHLPVRERRGSRRPPVQIQRIPRHQLLQLSRSSGHLEERERSQVAQLVSDSPLYEALVPQTGGLQAWSFPARSAEDAARIASRWCHDAGWLIPGGDPLELALREGGATDWTWFRAEARVEVSTRPIPACDNSLPKASQPDFAQGNLIYRAQLIEELDRIYMIRTQDEMEAELLNLTRRLKADPEHLSV